MPEDGLFGGSGGRSGTMLQSRPSAEALRNAMGDGLLPDASDFMTEREPEPVSGYLMTDFDDREEEHQQYLRDFFQKETCLYSHRVFRFAAQVFQAVKHERMKSQQQKGKKGKDNAMDFPNIDFKDANEKRLTFGLVFSTLKYQQFLEDMLDDCTFFAQYPEYRDDECIVMVVLCDFKLRKFQIRTPLPEETLDGHLSQIEQMLYKSKTKLEAALARSRIKACVISIDHLLPESVRKNDKLGANMCIHCWVNFIKTDLQGVQDILLEQDFVEVEQEDQLSGKTFYVDHHCSDVFAFPADQRDFLEQGRLIQEGLIVIQDKSSCVGPQSVRSLINEGDDVLHVNIGSGLATAHLASLTHGSDTVIYAFGVTSDRHRKYVESKLDFLGAKSRVKILTENFLDIDHNDDRLKHIKVALIMADCSKSAVANPVNFIVSEGEDMSILKDLSMGGLDDGKISDLATKHTNILKYATRYMNILKDLAMGALDDKKLGELVASHAGLLKYALSYMSILKDLSIGQLNDTKLSELVGSHSAVLKLAMRFPRIQAVVYCTRSLIEAENEGVVTRVIEFINLMYQKKTPFRVAPPVIPLTDADIEDENLLNGKYLRFLPSNLMSGCFIATVTREADDPKEAAKDILARAAARGIITGVPTKGDKKKKKGGKKKDKAKKEKKEGGGKDGKGKGKKGKVSSTPAFWPQTNDVCLPSLSMTSFSTTSTVHVLSSAHLGSPRTKTLLRAQLFTSQQDARTNPHHVVSVPFMNGVLSTPSLRMPVTRVPVHIPAHQQVIQHPSPFR